MTTENNIQEPEINPVTNEPVMPPMEEPAADAGNSAGIVDVTSTTQTPETDTPTGTETIDVEEVPVDLFTVPEAARLAPEVTEVNALADADRSELARLRMNEAEVNRVRQSNEQTNEAIRMQTEIIQRYVNQGYDQETSQRIAQDIAQERMAGNARVQQYEDAQRQVARHAEGKQNAATHYGKEYGVDPQALMGFDTPQAMAQYAALLKVTGTQSKRLSVLEGNTVDDGAPDGGSPSGSAPMTGSQLLAHSGSNPDWIASDEQQKLIDTEVQKLIG